MKCAEHREKDAIGACVSCGRGICEDCTINLAGKNYCQDCADELVQENNNMEQVKNQSKNLNVKSPSSAAALNLIIAGAGFIYIHEYSKAVVSFIIVWIAGIISYLIFGSIWYLVIVGYILIIVWSYNETKKYNKNLT